MKNDLFLASLGALLALATVARAADFDTSSDDESYADLWLRLDTDRNAFEGWIGGTRTFGSLNLAFDAVVTQFYRGGVDVLSPPGVSAAFESETRAPAVRLELGPAFSSGGLFLLPKLGLGYDFEGEELGPFVPSLMTIVQGGPVYLESWVQLFLYSPFISGAQDTLTSRALLLVAPNSHWALGVEADLALAVHNTGGDELRSLPIGPVVQVAPLPALTFGLFLGYEIEESARRSQDDFLAGRLTGVVLF